MAECSASLQTEATRKAQLMEYGNIKIKPKARMSCRVKQRSFLNSSIPQRLAPFHQVDSVTAHVRPTEKDLRITIQILSYNIYP